MGATGKISVVDRAFLVFIGFLYLPPTWKFSFEARKVSKRFLSVVVVYAFIFSDFVVVPEAAK